MPRAQKKYAHERTPHADRIGNFVVTHVRVVSQDQRHPGPVRQPRQTRTDFLAGVFGLQAFELVRIWMLERQCLEVACFEVLTYAPPPQHVPAVIASYSVEPRRKGPG